MNLQRIVTLARWEFRLLVRGPAFWLAAAAGAASAGIAVWRTDWNPHRMAYGLAFWANYLIPLCLAAGLTGARRRDEAVGAAELVRSRPVPGSAYLLAKFLGEWAALAAAWLLGLPVAVAVTALTVPGHLAQWPRVATQVAALVLPGFACVAAVCLAADVVWGRVGAVLAAAVAMAGTSMFVLRERWFSYLQPLLIPHTLSPVFGFDPYAWVIYGNKLWALGLAAALTGLGIWLLDRRVPALAFPGDRRAAWAFLAAGALLAGVALAILAPAPTLADMPYMAFIWEDQMVRAALRGEPAAQGYWQRHHRPGDPWPVEIWLTPADGEAAGPLAEAAARLLPHFPALQPAPGESFRIVQAGYRQEGHLVDGAVLVLTRDVRRAREGRALRPLLRAMAEADWERRVEPPPPYRHPAYGLQVTDLWQTWGAPPALVEQWCVLAAVSPDLLDRELDAWRGELGEGPAWSGGARASAAPGPGREGADAHLDSLWQQGAVGVGFSYEAARQALALWDLTRRLGCQAVTAALRAAAADPDLEATGPRWLPQAETAYWAEVSERLGTDVTRLPGWPRLPEEEVPSRGREAGAP